MLKYAALFLILSIIAGSLGFLTVSRVARNISLALFGIFLVIALAVAGFFILLERATAGEMGPAKPSSPPLITMIAALTPPDAPPPSGSGARARDLLPMRRS
ncbi:MULTISPECIES: DUF1328 domain-containing protein [Azorhizobium]|jgi:uncharacterized membrane protein YtjA (UPF0391 family)|nr:MULTISPECIES: DUF1328 domain-containing protein [Azorhizobium]TDT94414.1 uncharacterized protein DUF1328 [Azorhizobium sp. AG788]